MYKASAQSAGEGHLFLSAPPRSGKGRDILIPALLQYDEGSCIVIDPKGQLAAVTAAQRRRLGRVIILNPFNILPAELGPSAHYNPMTALDPASDTFGADCGNMADSIVTHEGGDRENHWSDSARSLVAGLIGHLANSSKAEIRNLSFLRKTVTSPSLIFEAATSAAADAKAGGDPFIAEALARYGQKDAENKGEIASIISTANTHTAFLGNRAIAASLTDTDNDFSFADLKLKEEPTTVYLVLPVRYLATCGKWFRLVLASALNELLTEARGWPVLCILDEFAQLGKLTVIENTLGLAAGLGVQLWPVLQDLTQLKDLYPNRWESFLGCAGIQMFFAPREMTTANYVSELCGDNTIEVETHSRGTSLKPELFGPELVGISDNTSTSPTKVPARPSQEIRRLRSDEFIMFWDGRPGRFIQAKRKPYWQQAGCKDANGNPLYSDDPYHKGGRRGPNKAPPSVTGGRKLLA